MKDDYMYSKLEPRFGTTGHVWYRGDFGIEGLYYRGDFVKEGILLKRGFC